MLQKSAIRIAYDSGKDHAYVDARGLKNIPLIEGAKINTMAELANWVVNSDKVVTF